MLFIPALCLALASCTHGQGMDQILQDVSTVVKRVDVSVEALTVSLTCELYNIHIAVSWDSAL